jgi:hypothetical protein
MKRIIVITALLFVTAVAAQGRPVASYSSIDDLPTASMPPGFKAVFDDAINAIRRGSAHPSAHGSACLARQRQLADDIESLVPSGPVDARQNPAMIELRTRCMPINPNPPVYW